MCLNPRLIEREGRRKETTYNGKAGEYYNIRVFSKCGYCQECMNEKSNNWVIRNYYESLSHEKKCFITLTYKYNPFFLIRKDVQDFMKRFRKALKKTKLRVFYAGEYGTEKGRPHIHIIVYGWNDENKKFLGFNKKLNPIYKSELVEKAWGLGRTTIQDFSEYEAPYIALYETARETEKRSYLLKRDKLKEEIAYIKTLDKKGYPRKLIVKMINELETAEKEAKKEKDKYISIREFNGWSLALGWKNFYEHFLEEAEFDEKGNNDNFLYKEYIGDTEFITPTPWIKKLANLGYNSAIAEMLSRTAELTSKLEEIGDKNYKEQMKKMSLEKKHLKSKKELEDWADTKKSLIF